MSGKHNMKINNLFDYIWSLTLTASRIQQEEYYTNPMDRVRSINIDPYDISALDFNISTNDATYQKLYQQGFLAAKSYFTS